MKSKLITVAVVLFFYSIISFADTTDTIPFITYTTQNIYVAAPKTTSDALAHSKTPLALFPYPVEDKSSTVIQVKKASTDNVPTTDLQTFIRKVRNAVCKTGGPMDIRIWISFDASGKILGMGTSSESGIEVTFHCSEKPT